MFGSIRYFLYLCNRFQGGVKGELKGVIGPMGLAFGGELRDNTPMNPKQGTNKRLSNICPLTPRTE